MRYFQSAFLLLAALLATEASASKAYLGVYEGAGCTGVQQMQVYDAWAGNPPNFAIDFLPYDSWSDFYNSANWALSCWHNDKMSLVLAVPMLMTGSQYTLAAGASGAYDSNFQQLAQLLVKYGDGGIILRLGWEFNGNWYPWSAYLDPTSWVAYYQHIVTVMRAVPGASNLRFDFNYSMGSQYVAPSSVYPGNAYVNFIGADVYNQSWSYPQSNYTQRWNQLLTESYGLNWLASFAASEGKPISIPEWATGTTPDGAGGGDSPYFVQQMAAWIASQNVYYQAYFDYDPSGYIWALSTGQQPNSAAEYVSLYH